MSVERRRLQTFWPGEDDIVPLPYAAEIDRNGARPTVDTVRAGPPRPPRLTAATAG